MGSTRQIWLAGLGAYIIAEREGSELFNALVQRGEKIEAQAMQQAKEVVGGFQERFEDIQVDTFNNLNKLEKVFQKRVMRALRHLGIPSREDIRHLARQVEALQQCVDEIIRLDQSQREPAAKKSGTTVEVA
jgi:poly(hydroxyalkanoate) granule-associated protein